MNKSALLAAALLLSAALHAQTPYTDPNGFYTVKLPAGWSAQPQPGTPMTSFVNEKLKASISLGVMRSNTTETPSVDKELQQIQDQFPQNCPQSKILDKGTQALSKVPGVFFAVSCANGSDGGQETMKFLVASGPGLMIVENSAAPSNNVTAAMPALKAIEASFRLAGAAGNTQSASPSASGTQPSGTRPQTPGGRDLSQSGNSGGNSQPPGSQSPSSWNTPAANGNTFRDPQGRYSLSVPNSWNVASDATAGTVTLSSGDSWAMVMTGSGQQAVAVNHDLTKQIQAQFTQFQLLNEGDLKVNNHPAHGSNATGINPKGSRVSVLIITVDAGSGHFLTVLSSAPNEQAKDINNTVVNMAQSIRFAGE